MENKPVRTTTLQYGKQHIDEADINAVVEVLRGDYLTTGPYVTAFEEELKQTTGVKYAIAISNGTTALHVACQSIGIGAGGEVITTPLTFAASANCVLYCGGTPVFADIDPNTMQIDIADIERKITPRTKAIIVVDYAGEVAYTKELRKLADKHGLYIIEDAAHSIGSTYYGKPVGSLADITTFSFHPVKTITTGEGGAVVTNNSDIYEKLKLFRMHGITRDASLLQNKKEGPWYYEQLELGNNYRMTDFQAALGTTQLDKLAMFKQKRADIVNRYNEIFADWKEFDVLQRPVGSDAARHLYPILLNTNNRRQIFEALQAEGIGVNVHYIPVYYFPYYEKLGYKKGLCPVAEATYERLISLPLYPDMTDNDVNDVVAALRKVFGKNE